MSKSSSHDPADKWIDAARRLAASRGIDHVKVDIIARQLGVTRGGFYHHFQDRSDLLRQLLKKWESENVFFEDLPRATERDATVRLFRDQYALLIHQQRFDPDWDLAMREWARTDARVRRVLRRVDDGRIATLARYFKAMGMTAKEAVIRAEALYLHQMGFYALGYHARRTAEDRMRDFEIYLEIVAGEAVVKSAADGGFG
jgi:AcrR family transcriptional regulator